MHYNMQIIKQIQTLNPAGATSLYKFTFYKYVATSDLSEVAIYNLYRTVINYINKLQK